MGKRFRLDQGEYIRKEGVSYRKDDFPSPKADFLKHEEPKRPRKLKWYTGLWTRIVIRIQLAWMRFRMLFRRR